MGQDFLSNGLPKMVRHNSFIAKARVNEVSVELYIKKNMLQNVFAYLEKYFNYISFFSQVMLTQFLFFKNLN